MKQSKGTLFIIAAITTVLVIYFQQSKIDFSLRNGERTHISSVQCGISEDKKNDAKWTDMLKCQNERINRLKMKCKQLGLTNERPLYESSEEELKYLTHEFISDDIHHVILKSIPKTGCTSWRTLFLNNTYPYIPKLDNFVNNPHNFKGIFNAIGLYTLPNYNKPAILWRLNTYFTILTVRHPFSRLESLFRDKRLDSDIGIKERQEKFDSFIDNVVTSFENNDHHSLNSHRRTYMAHAHPCVLPFKFITKTETANDELSYIMQEKLSNYGSLVPLNPTIMMKDDAVLKNTDRMLPLFSRLKDRNATIEKLMKYYGEDMELFGYKWEIRNGDVYSTCESYSWNGKCC